MPIPSVETVKLLAKSEAERRRIIREALEDQESVNFAADKLGVSRSFLWRIVRKDRALLDGIPLHPTGPWKSKY